MAYVSYSLDAQATWITGPKVQFTIGAPVTPVLPNEPVTKIQSATPTSVGVVWAAPTQPGGSIIGYQVTVKNSGGQTLAGYPKQLTDPSVRTYLAEGLAATTSYTVEVQAINSAGYGPASVVTQSTTGTTGGGGSTPNAPVVTVTATTTSTINVSWAAPTQPNGTLVNYRIGWDAPGGLPVPSWNDLYPTSTTSLNLTNLAVDSIYNIWVEAINSNGTGARYTVIQRTNSTGGGGNPGTNYSNLPVKSVGVYAAMWSNSPGHLSTLPNTVNVVYYAFAIRSGGTGPLNTIGYGPDGKPTMLNVYSVVKARGGKVILSLGGSGYSVELGDTTYLADRIQQISADLGGIDGLDFDLERTPLPSASEHVALCQALKARFGQQFAVTIAPGGANYDNYYPVAGELYAAGCMDMIGHQYYEGADNWSQQVSMATIRQKVNQAKGYGIPESNIGIGMMTPNTGNADPWDYLTLSQWQAIMQQTYNEFGISKCYLWELSDPQLAEWATTMRGVIGY